MGRNQLDPLRDMTQIRAGHLNNLDHLGLTVRPVVAGTPRKTGRIVGIEHGLLTTLIKYRKDGQHYEHRTDPETYVRIEDHTPWEGEDDE